MIIIAWNNGGRPSDIFYVGVFKKVFEHIYYCCNFEVGLRFLTLPSFPPSPCLYIYHITP
jgi:hypothetical protein